MKNWENLPEGTIKTIQALMALNMQTTGQATKSFLIGLICLFSFSLSSQTPTVIKLSELTVVVTPIKLGGSLMIGGLLLNSEKPIVTDYSYSCIWKSGETTVMMEFNRNCKECPASPIYYSDSRWIPSGHYLVIEIGETASDNTFFIKVTGLPNNSKEWLHVSLFQEFTPKSVIDFGRENARLQFICQMEMIQSEREKWTEDNVVEWIDKNTNLDTIPRERLEYLENLCSNYPG